MSLLLSVASLALAATPITLDQVRSEARNNTQALVSELDRLRAQDRVTSARAPLLPQLNLAVSAQRTISGPSRQIQQIFERGPQGDIIRLVPVDAPGSEANSLRMGLVLDQLLYDHSRWQQLFEAGAQSEAAQGQTYEQRMTSELEAVRRFYDLFQAQRSLQVLEKTVDRSQDQVQRATALFNAGARGFGKDQVLLAEVNLGNDQIRVTQQRSVLGSAQANLAIWIARSGVEELIAQDPGTFSTAPSAAPAIAEAVTTAQKNRPLIGALQKQVDAARHAAGAAFGDFVPSLSGQLSYGRTGSTFDPVFTDPARQNSLQGVVTLSWNLFSGLNTSSQLSQARHSQSIAQLNLDQARRDLEAEVARAHRAYQAQVEAFGIAQRNLKTAQSALSLAEERFKAGAGSTLEVRDAQLKLTQAELSVVESRIEVEVTRATLERAMGAFGDAQGATR